MIGVEPGATPSNGDQKAEFAYDYLGRRVEKKVWTYNSGWSLTEQRKFLYDGWLMILELDGSDNVVRKYTWGLDLAGQSGAVASGLRTGRLGDADHGGSALQGAASIGGLLALQDWNGTGSEADDLRYVYFYDANGNVGQVSDLSAPSASASIKAKYEYDPYGNLTAQSGDYAEANPFRWSTKYWDDETGLGYWGHRYYDPRLGRWLNRDPMEEVAGPNLYVFATNDPVRHIDPLGLKNKVCAADEEAVSNGKTPTVNGCGAGPTAHVVPDTPMADFTDACNKHDRCYADCKKTKKQCDDEFYNDMIAACMIQYGWMSIKPMPRELKLKQRACYKLAGAYHAAVRDLGEGVHTATQESFCVCRKKPKPPASQPAGDCPKASEPKEHSVSGDTECAGACE